MYTGRMFFSSLSVNWQPSLLVFDEEESIFLTVIIKNLSSDSGYFTFLPLSSGDCVIVFKASSCSSWDLLCLFTTIIYDLIYSSRWYFCSFTRYKSSFQEISPFDTSLRTARLEQKYREPCSLLVPIASYQLTLALRKTESVIVPPTDHPLQKMTCPSAIYTPRSLLLYYCHRLFSRYWGSHAHSTHGSLIFYTARTTSTINFFSAHCRSCHWIASVVDGCFPIYLIEMFSNCID